jgi:glutathione peroxidase
MDSPAERGFLMIIMALTLRQRLLKTVYPLFTWVSRKKAKQLIRKNESLTAAPASFYALSVMLNNGKEFSFEKLKGKKVLVVNTASNCGYTPQYTELQTLYQHLKEDLEIIAFPSNDFKEQEKSSDEEIAAFCSRNYGVSFPIAKKAVVVRQSEQHPVFQWLTDENLNGWNDKTPSWNFSKFLISESGMLTHYFEPALSPLSNEVMQAIHA